MYDSPESVTLLVRLLSKYWIGAIVVMLMQCGSVAACRPIFSTDDLNMDKHKFERFLHPGRFAVASIFAPICFPPLPLIVFKEADQREDTSMVASGSLRSVDPDRIILKKITLSGYVHHLFFQVTMMTSLLFI